MSIQKENTPGDRDVTVTSLEPLRCLSPAPFPFPAAPGDCKPLFGPRARDASVKLDISIYKIRKKTLTEYVGLRHADAS